MAIAWCALRNSSYEKRRSHGKADMQRKTSKEIYCITSIEATTADAANQTIKPYDWDESDAEKSCLCRLNTVYAVPSIIQMTADNACISWEVRRDVPEKVAMRRG